MATKPRQGSTPTLAEQLSVSIPKAEPARKKSAKNRIPYDVAFVGDGASNAKINPVKLKKALGKEPSQEFLRKFEIAVSNYNGHLQSVKASSPAAMKRRIKSVHAAGLKLSAAMEELQLNDSLLIGRFFTRKFIAEQPAVSEHEFANSLAVFLEDVGQALSTIDGIEKKGAMPAFAGQALAINVAQLLANEEGEFPALTRGGVFDRVLRYAFGAERSDVMDLMRHAKKRLENDSAKT